MSDLEELFDYRMRQAEETLHEAERMLDEGFSARSVINRSYYSMFYGVLALFIRLDVPHRTSKHSGIIGIFDRELVRSGKMDPRFSRMLHRLFEQRLQADYREFAALSHEDAARAVQDARQFVMAIREMVAEN